MIKTTLKMVIIEKPKPVNNPNVFAMVIPPTERVKSFSPNQFEEFILEWVIACVSTLYKDVYRIGGSGDMGRDVIGEYENGEYDYYQCKRYEGKLAPSEYWVEFGKLCYYTYKEEIPVPKKYYVIASQGLGPKMFKLINNSKSIKEGLIENWDEKCKTKISKGKVIELDDKLLEYIKEFDFDIVETYSIDRIIEEHRKTDYFYFRFGGVNKPKRNASIIVPLSVDKGEFIYVKKVLQAYSESEHKNITLDNLNCHTDFSNDFNRNRRYFYSAESLRLCIRDIFTDEEEFEKLKNEMYSGIIDFIEGEFDNGYMRLKKTMYEATKVNISVSIIDHDLHFVNNDDKKGLCHQIANDDGENKIEWSNQI